MERFFDTCSRKLDDGGVQANVTAVIHLGRALCGHDGIIHGGIISTVFDESLARNVSHAANLGSEAGAVDFPAAGWFSIERLLSQGRWGGISVLAGRRAGLRFNGLESLS